MADFSDPQTTISMIREAANDKGDKFRVKVMKRNASTGVPALVASFSDATLAHISDAEEWLTPLAGGGTYLLMVAHELDRSKQIGGPIVLPVGGRATDVNFSAVSDVTLWKGPPTMTYPVQPPTTEPRPAYSVPGGLTGSAPRTADSQGGETPGTSTPAALATAEREWQRLRIEEAKLAAERQRIEELRHRGEQEAMKRELDLKLEGMKAQFAGSHRPSFDPATIAATLGALTAPIIEVLKSGAETRREAARLAAESAARAETAAQRSQDTMMTLITGMLNKPAIDPELKAMLLKREDGADQITKVIQPMVESVSTVMSLAVETVKLKRELAEGEPAASPWLEFGRELIGGIGQIAQAQAEARQNAIDNSPVITPPAMPPPPVIPQRFAPPQRRPAPRPKAPPPPTPVQPQPVQPAPQPTLAEIPAEPAQPDPRKLPTFDRLIHAVKNHEQSDLVAEYFIKSVIERDPSVISHLQEAKGNLVATFLPYLEEGGWLNDGQNQLYLKEIIQFVQHYAIENGLATQEGKPTAAVSAILNEQPLPPASAPGAEALAEEMPPEDDVEEEEDPAGEVPPEEQTEATPEAEV